MGAVTRVTPCCAYGLSPIAYRLSDYLGNSESQTSCSLPQYSTHFA